MSPLSYNFPPPPKECLFILVYIYNSHLNHKEGSAFVQQRTRKQNHIEIRRTPFHVSVNTLACFPLKCVTLRWAFREADCRLFNCLPQLDY